MRVFLWIFVFVGVLFSDSLAESLEELKNKLEILDKSMQWKDNIWVKKYANFENYTKVAKQVQDLKKELKKQKTLPKTSHNLFRVYQLENQIDTLQRQMVLLHVYKEDPFADLIQKPSIGEAPFVANPIAIIGAFSFIKKLEDQKKSLYKRKQSLQQTLIALNERLKILQEMHQIDAKAYAQDFYQTQTKLLELRSAEEILETTTDIYTKESDEIKNRISLQIKAQIFKLIYIAIGILISIGFAFVLKIITRKYIHDNERAYVTSKIINFFNITIIIFILLFAYLENVTYLVTVLGFASAGLAIAMKDLFMSILGWFVIVVGGSVHVGDRIRVTKDGSTYVGDVLDISLLRITIYEDVTLTTFLENRRAGRIIFIPNNYIFTTMFSNYTHGGMKTVWDGVDFTITFDSNIPRACAIASEVATKYARGYTEATRRQLAKMRDKYSLRNSNVEPKTFSLLENNGVRISVWYQTNAYATLSLRSTISMEIIERLLKEPDIKISYSTTKLIKDGTDGFGNKSAAQFPIEAS
ncbi:Mechanosensitive ion channel membrane protein [Helicobacter mustelae]|uniref:Putative Mechanosensitive ion channel membrane protein n=1 Tax=Helicobacter mustelae (strain ATCC 43772 / CCUG 25715 / CIP 103759 / LMG 18044 / NCTC 12198 / R85-136P) TaxID=679897 RepID=D3UGZ9_HELM1|nr:mechanosensitive ion channel domain-containing protein [Helicobacter mustelae]CBG39771.1 putative Mechanosensitive ion channel membrane protein [Helicobacter mustelae 12198]SQH71280.1 Mechanosensitive ion channel membrane protein [Helicobacter mustelae]STP12405.1 Mechanosensitive ion channel membrane protein [Helicobacter mustelae]